MNDILAIATLMFWPIIPLFWIPVHMATDLFRRLGLFAYLLPSVTWLPVAFLIYGNGAFLIQSRIALPLVLNALGNPLFIIGILLHIWTAILLGGLGIIGVPEIFSKVKSALVKNGPFSVVRHPTYLAHTLIFTGVFLITEVSAVGIVAVVDFIVVNTIIIPFEEKELLSRFGTEYELYKKQVPARFFPHVFR